MADCRHPPSPSGLLIIYPDIRRIPTWDDILFGASFMVALASPCPSLCMKWRTYWSPADSASDRQVSRSSHWEAFLIFDEVTNRPRTELFIALAGPMVSIAIGLGAFILFTSVDQPTYVMTTEYFYTEDGLRAHAQFYLPEETTPGQAFQYVRYIHTLAIANIAIGLFNLLPLFPLDGGRILSATLWAITGNRARATRIAAPIGQLGAAAIIAYGAYNLFFGELLVGVWLIAIGVFLMEAASRQRPYKRIPSPSGRGLG